MVANNGDLKCIAGKGSCVGTLINVGLLAASFLPVADLAVFAFRGARIAEPAQVARGGAAAVRLGQAGENAVRGARHRAEVCAEIGERTWIFDGLSREAVSEVKNVASQAFTKQLKDSLAYAQGNGLRFDLYVRPSTYLTGPLRDAITGGFINPRYIP